MFSYCASIWQPGVPEWKQTEADAWKACSEVRSPGRECQRDTGLAGHHEQDGHGDQASQRHAGNQAERALQGMWVEIPVVAMLDVHERPHGDPPGEFPRPTLLDTCWGTVGSGLPR